MRYAIISDIHGNYSALKEVLKSLSRFLIDKVLCLGDIVGYGAEPNECLAAIQKECDAVLMGNHDLALIRPNEARNFNAEAKASIEWTRQVTKPKYITFIEGLPMRLKAPNFYGVHATPLHPEKWGYVVPNKMSGKEWQSFSEPICFIGHSHVPMVLSKKRGKLDTAIVEVEPEDKYIINVGSVGQPRDGDKRLCFGIYDDEEQVFELIRLEYDYKRAVQKIRKAGLPVYNSNRLLLGR